MFTSSHPNLTMPACCGSCGPMLCFNSAYCNETFGVCQGCPTGFLNDEVLFQGNINCGLGRTWIIPIYIVTSIFAFFVSISTLVVGLRKKKSSMRSLLFFASFWNFLLIFLMLAHYFDGFKFGYASLALVYVVLCCTNIQTSVLEYNFSIFLCLVSNTSSKREIYRFGIIWFVFWMSVKVIGIVSSMASLSMHQLNALNGVVLFSLIALFVEVSSNVFIHVRRNYIFVQGVRRLQSNLLTSAANNSFNISIELAQKLNHVRWLVTCYGVLFFLIGLLVPILYVIYDSSIPYGFVIFGFLVITWPLFGLNLIILLNTRWGREIIDRIQLNNFQTNHNMIMSYSQVEAQL